MAKVIITIEDDPAGDGRCNVEFGFAPALQTQEQSPTEAYRLATSFMAVLENTGECELEPETTHE